mmetsp:Transcript_4275/g.12482  ORF Transcript_4275/g.12482 Transcript_4275/m.12482 type:complete len:225 (-) Transcript_4275:281-955(-)
MERSLQLKPATRRSRSPGIGCGLPVSTSKFLWRPMCVTSAKSRPQSGKLARRNSCFLASNSTEKACSKPTLEPCWRSVRSSAFATMTGASVPEHMVPILIVLSASSAGGRRSPGLSFSVSLWSFSSIRPTMPTRLRGALSRRLPSSSSLASYSTPLSTFSTFSALSAFSAFSAFSARGRPWPAQWRHGGPCGVASRAKRRRGTSPAGTSRTTPTMSPLPKHDST